MTDTSKEATNSAWVNDACEFFDQHAQELGWQRHIYSDNLRALLSERDALRAQLQAAKDEALDEGLDAVSRSCFAMPGNSPAASYNAGVRDSLAVLRALKSTSAKGEG